MGGRRLGWAGEPGKMGMEGLGWGWKVWDGDVRDGLCCPFIVWAEDVGRKGYVGPRMLGGKG